MVGAPVGAGADGRPRRRIRADGASRRTRADGHRLAVPMARGSSRSRCPPTGCRTSSRLGRILTPRPTWTDRSVHRIRRDARGDHDRDVPRAVADADEGDGARAVPSEHEASRWSADLRREPAVAAIEHMDRRCLEILRRGRRGSAVRRPLPARTRARAAGAAGAAARDDRGGGVRRRSRHALSAGRPTRRSPASAGCCTRTASSTTRRWRCPATPAAPSS